MSATQLAALEAVHDHRAPKPRHPNGPTLLFFIRRGGALADPHRVLGVFEELATRWGGVASFRSGLRERTYVVADPNVARLIFEGQEKFSKYPHHTADLGKLQAMIGKGMLATHTDNEWAEHRRSVARNFAKKVVIDRYGPVVAQHVETFVSRIDANGACASNISELSMQLSGRIMSDMLAPGHPFADDNFLEIKRILDRAILEFHRRDFVRRAPPYKEALRRQAVQLVQTAVELKHQPTDGLVARFIADEPEWESDAAARERLLDRVINMVVAGYETTATTMNWIIYLLASHPEEQERLHAEVTGEKLVERTKAEVLDESFRLQRVVQEAMRLHSVLWFNIRYATQDSVVGGHRFDAGSRVMLLPFLANRSSALYSDPHAFRPDRYLQAEVAPLHPFGHGPRVCIGRTLAELEMQHLTAALSARFRMTPVSHPKPIGGVLLQPDADVLVRFDRR
jgi:cytochrome P450